MIEEVVPNLYKMEIPLPNNPLKALNSYVIKSQERNLIIDTGMNREECLKVMLSSLSELEIDLNQTDFYITHFHADHMGLVLHLAKPMSKIYFNRPDAAVMNSGENKDAMNNYISLSGFPEDELREANEKHPGYKYSPQGKVTFNVLDENDTVEYGDYLFRCLETPGHTNGHMCLYEPEKKLLMSGDHILGNITPNISLWSDDWDPLNEYINSLNKVSKLDIEMVLPGHRQVLTDCNARIEELKHHHRVRADEVLSVLKENKQNAYQVASQMTWDLTYESWDQFPAAQKWFATGEAIAHLKYLENKGEIRRETREQEIMFSLA